MQVLPELERAIDARALQREMVASFGDVDKALEERALRSDVEDAVERALLSGSVLSLGSDREGSVINPREPCAMYPKFVIRSKQISEESCKID